MFKLTKIFIILIMCIMVGMLVFKGVFITRALNTGKTLYQIDVNSFNGAQVYITEKYIVDPNTKCLSFKDEMGIKRIVCNNYTITEY
jgi:hypothetical protein